MTKSERLSKFLKEHPKEGTRVKLKIIKDNLIRKVKEEKENINKERAEHIFELWKELHTYQEIADVFGLTRERVRQILIKYHGDEFIAMKAILLKKKQALAKERMGNREWTCEGCKAKFKKRCKTKFCTRICFRKSISIVKYPDWLNGRIIKKENFSEWEWREINRIRTNSYYHRNQKHLNKKASEWRAKNKERFKLYLKRSHERKTYGGVITDLPNPININAMKGAQNSKEILAQCACNAVKYSEKDVIRWQPSIAKFNLLPDEKCPTCKARKV